MAARKPVRKYPDPIAIATKGRQTSQIKDQESSDVPRIMKVDVDI